MTYLWKCFSDNFVVEHLLFWDLLSPVLSWQQVANVSVYDGGLLFWESLTFGPELGGVFAGFALGFVPLPVDTQTKRPTTRFA